MKVDDHGCERYNSNNYVTYRMYFLAAVQYAQNTFAKHYDVLRYAQLKFKDKCGIIYKHLIPSRISLRNCS